MKAANLANNGLRVLALGYKTGGGKKDSDFNKKKAEKGLTFIGLIGIIGSFLPISVFLSHLTDPERKEVARAIHRCQAAGITVCMITVRSICQCF